MRVLDAKPVNLDGFSVADPDLGLVAMRSPYDPEPSLVVRDGTVVELDGKPAENFDVIDEFIARYGLDLDVAEVRRRPDAAGPAARRPRQGRGAPPRGTAPAGDRHRRMRSGHPPR